MAKNAQLYDRFARRMLPRLAGANIIEWGGAGVGVDA